MYLHTVLCQATSVSFCGFILCVWCAREQRVLLYFLPQPTPSAILANRSRRKTQVLCECGIRVLKLPPAARSITCKWFLFNSIELKMSTRVATICILIRRAHHPIIERGACRCAFNYFWRVPVGAFESESLEFILAARSGAKSNFLIAKNKAMRSCLFPAENWCWLDTIDWSLSQQPLSDPSIWFSEQRRSIEIEMRADEIGVTASNAVTNNYTLERVGLEKVGGRGTA